jgi:hypothetical protein
VVFDHIAEGRRRNTEITGVVDDKQKPEVLGTEIRLIKLMEPED